MWSWEDEAARDKLQTKVRILLKRDVDDDDPLWDAFWDIQTSSKTILEAFPTDTIRKILKRRFENLAILFSQATALLCQITEEPNDKHFPRTLTCIRVLTRIIPILMERGDFGDQNKEVAELCWGEDPNEPEPMAWLIIQAAMKLLFLPKFTCDYNGDDALEKKDKSSGEEKDVVLAAKPSGVVWAPGCGIEHDWGSEGIAASRKYDSNRIEVLRLLLTTCCDPLFSPADQYDPTASRWLGVATASDIPKAACVFYSLLNTIIRYDESTYKQEGLDLVEVSSQMLCVLLDCGEATSSELARNDQGHPILRAEQAEEEGFNVFRTILAEMEDVSEFTLIYNGLTSLLQKVLEDNTSYWLSSSPSRVDCFQELLVLMWKFFDENPKFTRHVLSKCDINKLVVPVCFLMYKFRRDTTKIGLVHICTFMLLKLSGERAFATSLGKKFDKKLPLNDFAKFTGSHVDLMVITLHKMVVNGAFQLVPLYSCFLTIISNIAPYWRKMSFMAAINMVFLFELFSSPKFLYSSEHAYRHVELLLEAFNDMIQYQWNGNHHMFYAIYRRKESFLRIINLTLKEAKEEYSKAYGGGGGEEKKEADSSEPSASFSPTEEWLEDMMDILPLATITQMLEHLVPVIERVSPPDKIDEKAILKLLEDYTLVGVLPQPHAINVRKYQPNEYTALWFTAFMWGVIFLRNQSIQLFNGDEVELFQVSTGNDDPEEEDDE